MKSLSNAMQELSYSSSRFETFKKLFNNFQRNIQKLDSSSLSGKITVKTTSELSSTVEFIARTYAFSLSTRVGNGALVGVINFSRISELGEAKAIKSISYNGEGNLNVNLPQQVDPLSLTDEVNCINLAANFILEELNT